MSHATAPSSNHAMIPFSSLQHGAASEHSNLSVHLLFRQSFPCPKPACRRPDSPARKRAMPCQSRCFIKLIMPPLLGAQPFLQHILSSSLSHTASHYHQASNTIALQSHLALTTLLGLQVARLLFEPFSPTLTTNFQDDTAQPRGLFRRQVL